MFNKYVSRILCVLTAVSLLTDYSGTNANAETLQAVDKTYNRSNRYAFNLEMI